MNDRLSEITSLTKDTKYLLTDLSNLSSYLYGVIDNINWIGFYLVKDGNLHLGPFQGKVACTYIECGKGVCGTCLKEKKLINVPNVHEFKGHIACDANSKSELCIPVFKGSDVFAILDVDSPIFNRFKSGEETLLLSVCDYISGLINEKVLF